MLNFMYSYKKVYDASDSNLLAILRPKFHPNDDDTTALLNKWRAELGFNPQLIEMGNQIAHFFIQILYRITDNLQQYFIR